MIRMFIAPAMFMAIWAGMGQALPSIRPDLANLAPILSSFAKQWHPSQETKPNRATTPPQGGGSGDSNLSELGRAVLIALPGLHVGLSPAAGLAK